MTYCLRLLVCGRPWAVSGHRLRVFVEQNENVWWILQMWWSPEPELDPELQGGALFTLSDADRLQASKEKYKQTNAIFFYWPVGTKRTIKQTAEMTTSNTFFFFFGDDLLPVETNYHLLSLPLCTLKDAKGLPRITVPSHQSSPVKAHQISLLP